MWQQIFLIFVGLSSGIIIAGGVVGLMIGLSIVPRYAGITHTADHMLLYEDMTFLGIVLGNLFCLFQPSLPLGNIFLILYGIFSGIFLEAGFWLLQKLPMSFPFSVGEFISPAGFPSLLLPLPPENLQDASFFTFSDGNKLSHYMHKTHKSQKKSCLFANIFISSQNLSGKE